MFKNSRRGVEGGREGWQEGKTTLVLGQVGENFAAPEYKPWEGGEEDSFVESIAKKKVGAGQKRRKSKIRKKKRSSLATTGKELRRSSQGKGKGGIPWRDQWKGNYAEKGVQ